jgi:ribosome-associated protein
MTNVTSEKLASVIARILDDKLAYDIQILNISNISIMADYFVIASGNSTTQVKATTAEVREKIKEYFNRIPQGNENDPSNRWNLLDYGDVVVHIMHFEQRQKYLPNKMI